MRRCFISIIGLVLSEIAESGCVYSRYKIDMSLPNGDTRFSTGKIIIKGGDLVITDVRRKTERTLFYPPYFSFSWGYGHDGWDSLAVEWICHVPTCIPEILFAALNESVCQECIRLPLFKSNISELSVEYIEIGVLDGRRFVFGEADYHLLAGECSIVFSTMKDDLIGVKLIGTIKNNSTAKTVDYGTWGKFDVLFVHGRQLYVIHPAFYQDAEWRWFNSVTQSQPVVWRINPFTGDRKVLVSFKAGDFIIENSPPAVLLGSD